MPRQQVNFVCQECGYDSPQWLGKCPECGNWNSFKEIKLGPAVSKGISRSVSAVMPTDVRPEPLRQVSQSPTQRIPTGFAEMDNVLGGGLVPGSATLLAGDPGIGKSTLLLQLCLNLAAGRNERLSHVKTDAQQPVSNKKPFSLSESRPPKEKDNVGFEEKSTFNSVLSGQPLVSENNPLKPRTVLYVSGEESKEQVSMRASRIGKVDSVENLLLLSLTNTDQIAEIIASEKPDIVVIDSIQTMESENGGGLSGSVSQVRYASSTFIRLAKTLNIPVILVGHVTKEGMVAGPMVLSHMVDTVMFLEGEKFTSTRILRSLKNRFGPVDEVGVFQMEEGGMVEVKNPEQIFLSNNPENVPGSVLVVIMEGTRPFLIEIQALVVYSKFPMPRRVASGFDSKRLELLLAVLQKHCRLPVETSDVFVNVAGGIKVSDPAVDLGVCLAVYSSLKNVALAKTVGIAEVGLLGELRKVSQLEKRIKEAKKLGFKNIITALEYKNLPQTLASFGIAEKGKSLRQKDERHFTFEPEE